MPSVISECSVNTTSRQARPLIVWREFAEKLFKFPSKLWRPIETPTKPFPGLANSFGERARAGGLSRRDLGKIRGSGVEASQKATDFSVKAEGSSGALGGKVGLFDLSGVFFHFADLAFGFSLGVPRGGCDLLWGWECAVPLLNVRPKGGKPLDRFRAGIGDPESARAAKGGDAGAAENKG